MFADLVGFTAYVCRLFFITAHTCVCRNTHLSSNSAQQVELYSRSDASIYVAGGEFVAGACTK